MQDGNFLVYIHVLLKYKLENRTKLMREYIKCRVAAYTEWKILYVLCKDKNGLLHKDTVRAVYDGSLFERMEKENSGGDEKKE